MNKRDVEIVVRIRQQTRNDLVLQLSTADCDQLLAALYQLQNLETAALLSVDIVAPVLKYAKPRVVKLSLTLSDQDELHRVGQDLEWSLDPDTLNGTIDKVLTATRQGYFSVAELATVKGVSSWIRLYAELDQNDDGNSRSRS